MPVIEVVLPEELYKRMLQEKGAQQLVGRARVLDREKLTDILQNPGKHKITNLPADYFASGLSVNKRIGDLIKKINDPQTRDIFIKKGKEKELFKINNLNIL